MSIEQAMIIGGVVIWLHMTFYYLLSLFIKDASVVDVGWGLGFVLVALSLLASVSDIKTPQLLVASLVTLWGLRLAIHILSRKAGKPEDWRYQKMRRDWGSSFVLRSYFQIFMFQGLIMFLMSAPIFVVMSSGATKLGLLGVAGFLAWAIGFVFESVGDYQLRIFLKNKQNPDDVMTYGLWSYTRHPNYFGEIAMWWGLFLIVAQLDYGLVAIISPIVITFLLLKVSGVTMLEAKYQGNKQFAAYKKRTSAVFPLPPKK